MTSSNMLALLGGPRAIPPELIFRSSPEITSDDERTVLESLRGNSHSWGPHCVALQNEFAQWNGNRFCAATNSGTAALHMCVAACDVGAGDEVITTTMSWTSSATSILHHNAIPVFADVDWDTMLIDPLHIERAITPKTKAILPVHYWGLPCDMDAIRDIAQRHGLLIIEDACQAHGALYKGQKAGTLGDVAAFSLQASKNLCGGEGGLFVTNERKRFQTGWSLMNFGEMRPPGEQRDFHAHGMGWMYRTPDLSAAFALSQLRRLDVTLERTRRNWLYLHDKLEGIPKLVRPFTSASQATNGYAYVLRCDRAYAKERGVSLGQMRDALMAALKAEGVPVQRARWLLPAHTVFQARNGYGNGCPWTCSYSRPGVSYDLSQYPNGVDCVDSSIWIATGEVQPIHHPNDIEHMDAIAAAIVKVFGQIDAIPIRK